LLKQRQQRNKVGGVIDRRFGEDDPDMDPEERMLERFAMEKRVFILANGVDCRNGQEICHYTISRIMPSSRISDSHLLKSMITTRI
jgi:nucleolar protein 14